MTVRSRAAAAALLALLVTLGGGCGDEGVLPPPPDCSSVADTTQPATVSFAADVTPLFSKYNCLNSGCHGAPLVSSEYSVSSYEEVLTPGVEAQRLGMCVVRPGAVEESYIIWKLENRPGILGLRMPYQTDPVDPADLETIRTWIEEGARDN